MPKKLDSAVAVGAAVVVTGAAVMAARTLMQGASNDTISDAAIARFLTQCTFGVTDADLAAVKAIDPTATSLNALLGAWIDDQMNATKHPYFDTVTWAKSRVSKSPSVEAHYALTESFWIALRNPDIKTTVKNPDGTTTTTTSPGPHTDVLRQRMKFALSQIFVISQEQGTLEFDGAFGTIGYFDLLDKHAFGNFRDLMEAVTYNTMMGIYLTYVENLPEDPASGRHPDENYARELMQLFTIGTTQLNQDGTSTGVPTYSHDDIAGLAKVFTGLSWATSGQFFSGFQADYLLPMIPYPGFHSWSAKTFLGHTIPASTPPTPGPGGFSAADSARVKAEVSTALDVIFNHPNVGPFIATRLIKSFVTSNPSTGYVSRIAGVFNDNGHGVRGDLAAVVKAMLLDDEARDTASAQSNANYGKVREPAIRIANWIRSFEAKSKNGFFDVENPYSDDESHLSEEVLDAPSVFNFWSPLYVPPRTDIAKNGLTAPEFQVVSELTVASYANLIQTAIGSGIGINWKTFSGFDVSSDYTKEMAIANDTGALLDRINLLLFYGQMPSALRTQIQAALNKITISTTTPATGLKNRAKLAIFLSMCSPEYLIQR